MIRHWLAAAFLFLAFAGSTHAQVPAPAAAVGYNTRTYGPSLVVGHTANPNGGLPEVNVPSGANWYPFTYFGTAWANIGFTVNGDGSIALSGTGESFGNGLSSSIVGPPGATSRTQITGGQTFGGGAYFEATMKNTGSGPMSFWSNDVESMNGASLGLGYNQWPGQTSGYRDSIENDFMEFDWPNHYSWSVHNWYNSTSDVIPAPYGGPINGTHEPGFIGCPNSNPSHIYSPPLGVDYTQYHKYGFLWVPATATSLGYGQPYFDGSPVGNKLQWNKYNSALAPPPISGPVTGGTAGACEGNNQGGTVGAGNAWSVMDTLHLSLILGAQTGGGSTTTISSVEVWQATGANDLPPISTPGLCAASADRSTLSGGSASVLTDAAGQGWGIPVNSSYVFLQGSSLIATSHAIELAYVSGSMWYQNASGQWYSFNGNGQITSGPTTSPLGKVPVPAPLSGTVTTGSWVTNQLLTFPGSPSGYAGMRYNYLLPQGYDPVHYIYPLMMVGAGNDQGMNGGTYPRDGAIFIGGMESDSFLFNTVAFRTAHPAVIVAVQCDQTLDLSGANPNANCGGYGDFANGYWNERAISAVQSFARTNFSIDPNRLYWDGLSLSAIGFAAQAVDNNQTNNQGNASVTAYVGMSMQLFRPATPNANVFARMTNVPSTTICSPGDNPCNYDEPLWQFITGNTNYPTKTTYAGGMPAIRAGTSQFYFIDLTTTGGTAYGQFGCLAADGCSPGGDAIYNWLFSINGSSETLSMGTIVGQVAGASFQVSGTISNAPAVPTLKYAVNGGTFQPLPAGSSVTLNSYSFTEPGLVLGASNTITVEDANNTSVSVTSNVFAVTGNTGIGSSPLPSGYLSVSGNQIIDGSNNNVRMACSGYDHPTGSYSSDMSIMRAQGFNCARFDLYGAQYCPSVLSGGTYIAGTCNFSVLDQVVNAATANNMKIVFDMHASELGCGGAQPNGLWYDLNSATTIAGVAWNSLLTSGSGCISGTGGNFSVSGGYLIDPTGAKFIPEGPNVSDFVMNSALQNTSAFPITTLFPKINYIRIAVCVSGACPINGSSGGSQPTSITYPPVANYAQIAAYCQANKIACEFEDHTSNGGFWEGSNLPAGAAPSYPPTGALLASTEAFWRGMATQFIGNPYAWIGTINELGVQSFNGSDIARYSAYDLAMYNTIRATGNNNIIDLQAGSGAIGQGTMGPSSGLVVADYAGMKNIIFRMHYYSSTDVATIEAQAKGTTAHPQDGGLGCWGYACQQQILTADGVPPMIINEFGSLSGDGTTTDAANISTAMTHIQVDGIGSSAEDYFNENCVAVPLPGNQCYTQVNNGLTLGLQVGTSGNTYYLSTWGKEAAAVIAANPFPGGGGGGSAPTKTYQIFKIDWTNIGAHYKGNATVIALDLWHEPASTSTFQSPTVNWGGLNGADARLMCSDTGAAVEAADPGVLVICEGPFEATTFLNGVAFQPNFHNFMDLTLAASKPVTLAGDAGSHVVYSIHDLPSFGQNPPWLDSGAGKITMMTTAWGYLMTGHTAPVWVGTLGASLDGSDGFLSDETAWANTLTTYMNGQQGTAGGPIFSGCQQPVGGNWYTFGNLSGTLDGTLNANGTSKAGQMAFWSTLLYTTCGGGGAPPPGATTWNPNDIAGITLSNANLTATSHGAHEGVRATTSHSSGSFCAEALASTITSNWTFGLANSSYTLTAGGGIGSDGNAIGLDPNSVGGAQAIAYNNQFLSTGTGVSPNGEKETGCFNLTTNRAWFTNATMRGNGLQWNNSATANPATGVGGLSFAGLTCPCFLTFGEDETGAVAVLNAVGPFAVATPTGFLPWQTPVVSAGRPFILVGG